MSSNRNEIAEPHAAPARKGRWGTGPKAFAWVGAILLAVGIVAGAVGAWAFVSMVPVGVIGAGGAPGSKAIAGATIPGEVEIEAVEGQRIVVWEAVPFSAEFTVLRDDIQVDDGAVAVRPASVGGSSNAQGVQARTVAEFVIPADGVYTVAVTSAAEDGARFVLADGDSFPAFFSGLFGTILLWFVAIGGGMLGVIFLVIGIVWGMTRARQPSSS